MKQPGNICIDCSIRHSIQRVSLIKPHLVFLSFQYSSLQYITHKEIRAI